MFGHRSFCVKGCEGVLVCVLVYLGGISSYESVLPGNGALSSQIQVWFTLCLLTMLLSGLKGSLPLFLMCFLVELPFSDLNSPVFHSQAAFVQPCPEFGTGDVNLRAAFYPVVANLQHK